MRQNLKSVQLCNQVKMLHKMKINLWVPPPTCNIMKPVKHFFQKQYKIKKLKKKYKNYSAEQWKSS